MTDTEKALGQYLGRIEMQEIPRLREEASLLSAKTMQLFKQDHNGRQTNVTSSRLFDIRNEIELLQGLARELRKTGINPIT